MYAYIPRLRGSEVLVGLFFQRNSDYLQIKLLGTFVRNLRDTCKEIVDISMEF